MIAYNELADQVVAYMERTNPSPDEFNELALKLFSYQYRNNAAFQAFCRQRGKTERTVKHWQDIPAVPINGFKEFTLSCTDPERAEAVFMTSGTTNPDKKGKHYHPTLRVYDYSMLRTFPQRVLQGRENMRLAVLFPTQELLPHSSLAHYLHLAFHQFGKEGSQYFADEHGIDYPRLVSFLRQAEADNEPLLLLGATFSFVHVLDWLREQGLAFQLPQGSKLMDTGGVKGRSREIDAAQFYAECSAVFGVPQSQCINMYGMTELSTQFYDDGNHDQPSKKSGPHWIRTRAVNPLTGEDMPPGESGVLVHCDLANVNSVTTIMTEDAGYMNEDGSFVLLGRVQGAEAKGCSLALEDFLQAVKGNA